MSSVDLFTLANSGVTASSKLLQTTSNNIANVNTQGYTRERTELENSHVFGVEVGSTERIVNTFAQNQLRRDITQVGELEAFSTKTSLLDDMLANESNSLSAGLSGFFSALQTASDDPTNLASREQVLGSAESLYKRMGVLTDFMAQREDELNDEIMSEVNRANSLIQSIGVLNKNIIVANGNNTSEQPTALLNERDQAINELAAIMSIEVRESTQQNGAVMINLTSGDSLVLENGTFNLFDVTSDADLTFKQLSLSTDFGSDTKNDTSINVFESELGGSLGGLFRYRDDVLGPAMRDVGQLSLAFADALNAQNNLGMDLDGQLGNDVFTMPVFQGLNYEGTPGTQEIFAQVTEGKGSELTDADYRIEVTNVAAGVPTEVEVTLLNSDGTPQTDGSGNDLVFSNVAITTGYNEIAGGIEIEFTTGSGYSIGDSFLLQPTKNAATEIDFATKRAEDLAFAAPIRVDADINNLGGAQVIGVSITNTEVGTGNDQSAFDGAGGIHDLAGSPSTSFGAPAQIVFTSETSFEVLDGESPANVITTVSGVTDLNNLLAQAEANGTGPAWPTAFSSLDDYPGYDVSLEGVPAAGDTFTLSYNTDGFNDNTNALSLASLQGEKLVQLSSESTNEQRSFHDAYASLVGRIGEDAATANVSLQAAEAMQAQSENWFESVSGVSLDEEASNLIKYQQSYAAAARILSTAQELFSTILQAAR
ncbi:flagellar hook-associated protein FlgK [Alteromonas sp. KUL49]|uniref:flagellar hook-associated protein FlgK n=1 Tax=Alteromonas sp. KUL49 TaxID=2480798 RepID=UPI00102F1E0F|nr:flagellar hook-associated protein FlgK [Alteromonas sp. KUL49]TAP39657.1 flagellar hook-associated protein FlgK [Alteromonas sp. KUL49]GEA11642.1 flagellar hook protein FlgK [Alteromonas sp. KUL49]